MQEEKEKLNIDELIEKVKYNKNGWGEWGKHVLLELERLSGDIKDIYTIVNNIDKKAAVTQMELKLKAGIFGFIGSAIPVTILFLVALMKGKI